jgi:hypothetical protein
MKFLRPTLLALLIAAIALYLGDVAIFQIRGNPTSSITVNQLIAIPLKGNKTEYDSNGITNVTCARALFPQGNWDPCWLVARNQKKIIKY